jgi:anti-sigma factor ChrR (cupin superfamily)
MIEFDCNGDWLLAYADGELSATDSAQAESHLATCPSCSREVAALQNSREMLSAYFATADAHVGWSSQAARNGLGSPLYNSRPRVSWNAAALASASIAATALLVSMFFFLGREQGEGVKVVSPSTEVPVAPSAAEQPQEDDVLALISRETQIARLRMASEILAKEPGMNERHLAIEKYLTQTYGVTTKRQPFEM